MTPLAVGEFCQFGLRSRLSLLRKDGQLLREITIEGFECKLFRIYDFYVELYYDCAAQRVVQLTPVTSQNMLALYSA